MVAVCEKPPDMRMVTSKMMRLVAVVNVLEVIPSCVAKLAVVGSVYVWASVNMMTPDTRLAALMVSPEPLAVYACGAMKIVSLMSTLADGAMVMVPVWPPMMVALLLEPLIVVF